MEVPIGTCSLCGGDVVNHVGPYHSIVPPVPHCVSCGAVKAAGPVIPMRPAHGGVTTTGSEFAPMHRPSSGCEGSRFRLFENLYSAGFTT